jgi:Asp-tRNA(Asn)/Glu-tRNA(Gln) amidotransferase C subunit
MDLKRELIENVTKAGFDQEQVGSLIEEIEEIFAFEDSLDEKDRRERSKERDSRRLKRK